MNYQDKIDFLSSEDIQSFLTKKSNEDPSGILLNPPAFLDGNEKLVADQLLCRNKARHKLPTWIDRRGIIFPYPVSVEQASSEVTGNYKSKIVSGNTLIDLTGGMGVDCLALSDQFERTVYIEKDPWISAVFHHNSRQFEKDIQVINQSAESFIVENKFSNGTTFFIDPARRSKEGRKVFGFEDCSPNVIDLIRQIPKGHTVLIKASPMIDIHRSLDQLGFVEKVHVVAVKGEVKELLFLLHIGNKASDPAIKSINILANGEAEKFDFTQNSERQCRTKKAVSLGKYIYDPNDSIIKAGAFESVGDRFDIHKIALNTHLYTSDKLLEEFPGRVFHVTKIQPGKIDLKPFDQLNFISKNSPIDRKAFQKKYKIKEGGDHYFLSFRNDSNKVNSVLASRIK